MGGERERFPLSWPAGWKRTPYGSRRPAPFHKRASTGSSSPGGYAYVQNVRLSVGDATSRLLSELRRLGASSIIISSNLRIRGDGLPYADQAKRLEDPGVAVYFKIGKGDRVLACDRWNSVADNMAAIAGHINAIRACDRYGVGSLEQAFAGYAALPANTAADWRSVFGLEGPVSVDAVNARFRELAGAAHPDRGGSHDAMARLTEAKGFALRELGS